MHHARPTPTRPNTGRARRLGLAAALALILLGSVSTVAGAKEVGSGSGATTTTVCNPVSSLSYRGDARVGETGLASIDVDYVVKSCTKAAVTASVTVRELLVPSNVVWDQANAPLSGRFTVFGVKVRTSYLVRVDVLDAATGTLVGTRSITAAAIPKGV